MANRDKIDNELDSIIGRINKVQTSLGVDKDEKVALILGEDGKVDRWQELKQVINDRFVELRTLADRIAELKSGSSKESHEDRIRKEQAHRGHMNSLDKEIREMELMQKTELKKKRSKYTKADLEIRANEVMQIKHNYEDFKELVKRGFIGNREGYGTKRLVKMEDSELFKPGEAQAPQEAITNEQRQKMMQIEKRDAEIDKALEGVGKGVDRLNELALSANQKVKETSLMLDDLGENIEEVQDRVENINDKLKETLDRARAGDKLCVVSSCFFSLFLVTFSYIDFTATLLSMRNY